MSEKIKQVKRILKKNEALIVYNQIKCRPNQLKYLVFQYIISASSPVLLFLFSSLLQKLRNRYNLTN